MERKETGEREKERERRNKHTQRMEIVRIERHEERYKRWQGKKEREDIMR